MSSDGREGREALGGVEGRGAGIRIQSMRMDLFSIKGGRKRRLCQRRARKTESLPRVQSMTRKQIKHQPFACTWLPSHSFPNSLSSKASLTLRNPRHCPMLLSGKKKTQARISQMHNFCCYCWRPLLVWPSATPSHLCSVLTLAFINEWAHLPCLPPWLWLSVDQFHYSFSTDQYHRAFILLQRQSQ